MVAPTKRAAGHSVLVVDDDESIRVVVRRVLEYDGWTVIEAEDGLAALDVLRTGPPTDVVLLDIMMPRLDGVALLTHLREDERWGHLPVVMLTARERPGDRAVAAQLGARDFIHKPFDPATLSDRLLAALDGPEPPA